jgi:hypothetical protein
MRRGSTNGFMIRCKHKNSPGGDTTGAGKRSLPALGSDNLVHIHAADALMITEITQAADIATGAIKGAAELTALVIPYPNHRRIANVAKTVVSFCEFHDVLLVVQRMYFDEKFHFFKL